MRDSAAARYIAVALLIAALIAQVLPPLFSKSGVCDEHGAHLPSGYVYWKTGVFSGGIDNPPLMQLIVSAPMVLEGREYTPFSDEGLWAARLSVLVLSVLLGLAVYAWAGSLYGRAAAAAALLLYCFEPNVIAHSGLATLDLGVTAFLFLAFFCVWRASRADGPWSWMAACVAMTLALLSKFTALLMLPAFVLLLLFALSRQGPPARRLRVTMLALLFLASCMAALSHLAYHMPAGGEAATAWLQPAGTQEEDRGGSRADGRHEFSPLERGARALLPDLYVDGTLGKLRHTEGGHFAYLAGKRSMDGWWYYFPVALALKTPVPLLAALLISVASGVGLRGRGRDPLFLFLPLVFYIAAMAWTGINIGVRHVLLFYPLAAVAASGVLSRGLPKGRAGLALLAAGALWHVGGAIRVHPHYLAYFNEIAGGPGGGSRYLIDSNIDWGQDENLLMGFILEQPDTVMVNPGAFSPAVGTIAVNVNSLRGIFRGDGGAYKWLEPFEPYLKLGYTWHIYNLEVEDYARAAGSSPSSHERKVWLASALRQSGRLEEALTVSAAIAREFPDRRGNALFTSGWWLMEAGRYAEAEKALGAAVEENAGDEAAQALGAAGAEIRRAEGTAQPADFNMLGEFYARKGLVERSRDVIGEGIAAAPGDGELRLTMALLHGREGDYAGALEEAGAALELDPGLSRARRLSEWARDMLEVQGGRGTFDARMEMGRLEYQFGRPAKAAAQFWNAFSMNPSSQAALAAMGEIIVRAKLGVLDLETPWDARWRPQTEGSRIPPGSGAALGL